MKRQIVGIVCDPKKKAQQQFKNECNINHIVARARKIGQLPYGGRVPMYIDTIGAPTYQQSLDIVMKAEKSFAALPATVRARFSNDPFQLLEWLGNENNREEAVKMGLIEQHLGKDDPSQTPVAQDVPVTNE